MTNRNDNPTIYGFNKRMGSPANAPYCGNSLYMLCREAGFHLEIPKYAAPAARNWKRWGTIVWDRYNGWKPGMTHTPKSDEIFVVVFNWNGQNHVGVALQFHGGINFITGEGNTSGSKVRDSQSELLNLVGKPQPPAIYIRTYETRQGIWSRKQRYGEAGLVAVVAYKIN